MSYFCSIESFLLEQGRCSTYMSIKYSMEASFLKYSADNFDHERDYTISFKDQFSYCSASLLIPLHKWDMMKNLSNQIKPLISNVRKITKNTDDLPFLMKLNCGKFCCTRDKKIPRDEHSTFSFFVTRKLVFEWS